MRIVASRVIRVGGSTASAVGTARAARDTREGLFLVLTADDGREGLGEASPLPGYSPDTIDMARAVLTGIHLALGTLEGTGDAIDAVARAKAPAREELAESPSARFAIETALLDLLGRVRDLSVHRLLGARAPSPVRRSALLPSPCDSRTLGAAREALARGVSTLKLKLGARPFEEELAALVALRAALGEDIELRLDANGSLGTNDDSETRPDVGLALERLRALAGVKPAFVEEPVGGAALLDLLGRSPAVPVAADESLADVALADALLVHPALGAVVVKPALLGFLGARESALRAASRNVPVVVTHLFDGPIALAACAELALSLPRVAACGLDPHPALVAFPAMRVEQLDHPSSVRPVTNVGLGIRLANDEVAAWR